jgi:potassium efflux system protein
LRAKQRHYNQLLDGLRQWKTLIEQSLSGVSDQVLRQALRIEDTRLMPAERDSAKRIHATLQERAGLELRAVGALVFTEDLTARLHAELSEQVSRISIAGKLHSVLEDIGAVFGRIWSTELYIAEDSVIAGGQKISIPRSITLGKVVIAMTIFVLGLILARWAYRLTRRFGLRWLNGEQETADASAKAFAALVALVSLLVAMASVRIPWTVFAFMGGALAIAAGFGAQTLINNFISGVILLCERSIRVGDIVQVDDQRGKIMRVGFRNSLVARGDGIEVLVPNSQFLEKKVVNWTLSNDLVRYAVSVDVAYGACPAKVTELIGQAAAEHPHVIKVPAPDVLLEDFGDNALVFSLQFWMRLCPTVDGGKVRSELRHRIHALFDRAGISIAFPQRDLHLDSIRPLEIRVVNSPATHSADIQRSNGTVLACKSRRT